MKTKCNWSTYSNKHPRVCKKKDCKTSKGWLESFKQRNNIVYRSMRWWMWGCKDKCVGNWTTGKKLEICSGYKVNDIINVDRNSNK